MAVNVVTQECSLQVQPGAAVAKLGKMPRWPYTALIYLRRQINQ